MNKMQSLCTRVRSDILYMDMNYHAKLVDILLINMLYTVHFCDLLALEVFLFFTFVRYNNALAFLD